MRVSTYKILTVSIPIQCQFAVLGGNHHCAIRKITLLEVSFFRFFENRRIPAWVIGATGPLPEGIKFLRYPSVVICVKLYPAFTTEVTNVKCHLPISINCSIRTHYSVTHDQRVLAALNKYL